MTSTDIPDTLAYVKVEEQGPNCLLSTAEIANITYRSVNLNMRIFTEEEAILNPDEHEVVKEIAGGSNLVPIENNEKCLLIVESLFLIKALRELPTKKATLIYIGGNSGIHLNHLAEMFPMITFHIYEEMEMPKLIEKDNLVKFNEAFTDDKLANYRTNEQALLMISNFRNKSYAADPSTEEMVLSNANIILSDMEKQKHLFHLIKPEFALLLFRPLLAPELKLTNSNSFSYPTGIHFLLPYAKHRINSTMLMLCRDASDGTYFHKDIINRLAYHNNNTRNNHTYLNPYTHLNNALISLEEVKASGLQLDFGSKYYTMNCGWDCRYAYFVFILYLKEIRGIAKPEKSMLDNLILRYFSLLENARNA